MTSPGRGGFTSPSGPGWFPPLGLTPETQPAIPQLNAAVHNELTELGGQFEQLQTWSLNLPPTDDDMEAARDSEGEQTVRGLKAPSETRTIGGLDMQELNDSDNEEMDEGEVNAMPSVPMPVGPKEVTPKKDDTQC